VAATSWPSRVEDIATNGYAIDRATVGRGRQDGQSARCASPSETEKFAREQYELYEKLGARLSLRE
jgi:hypothetical protein